MRAWIGIMALACAFGTQAGIYHASGSSSYNEVEATSSYIEQGELRKFSSDIKGEILKAGMFQLIQGKPYTAQSSEDVFDVIKRIKAGQRMWRAS